MDIRARCLPEGWYPGSAAACRREIENFNEYIQKFTLKPANPRGGIVPHAGWFFSGRLAALVFHLCSRGNSPDVVVIFGGHLGQGPGIIYAEQAWSTPLGDLEIDQGLTRALMERVKVRPEGASTGDNTVEIQLPLVKYYFPQSRLAAMRAPHSPEAINLGRETVQLAREQGKKVMVFGSTDLTHYGPNYGFSPRGRGSQAVNWVREENDKGLVDLALAMDGPGLLVHAAQNTSACSAGAAAAAAAACRTLGAAKGLLADYYTSYDIMPGDSFVGYAGIVYSD